METNAGTPAGQSRRVDAAELLVEAGAALAGSLDPQTTMREVAKLTVPRLADLCVIDLLDDEDEADLLEDEGEILFIDDDDDGEDDDVFIVN